MPYWIIENTLLAAMLALLIALACRFVRIPPVIRHGLWLIVFIRLIVPPVFSLGLNLPAFRIDRAVRTGSTEPSPPVGPGGQRIAREQHRGTGGEAFPTRERSVPKQPVNATPEAPQAANELLAVALEADDHPARIPAEERPPFATEWAAEAELPPPVDEIAEAIRSRDSILSERFESPQPESGESRRPIIEPAIASREPAPAVPAHLRIAPAWDTIVWSAAVAGSAAAIVLQVIRLIGLALLLKRSRPAAADFRAIVGDLAERLSLRPPEVRISSQISSPVVCALGRATLLWPAARLDELSGGARQAVIVHELAHLARRDHWVGWLELLSACAWWWNPLFWYVRHQLHENAELACDAWVMAVLPEGRSAYARALVDLAERDAFEWQHATALGVGSGSRKFFERRLVMIMGETVRYRLGAIGLVSIGLLAVAVVPGCSTGQASEEPAVVAIEAPVDAPNTAADLAKTGPQQPDPFAEAVDDGSGGPPRAQSVIGEPAKQADVLAIDEELPAVGAPRLGGSDPSGPPITAGAGPGPSNDERLKSLEDRLDALLAEIRELKGGTANRSAPGDVKRKGSSGNKPSATSNSGAGMMSSHGLKGMPGMGGMMGMGMGAPRARRADDQVEEVTLTRSTYKLPHGRAEALAAFFKANLTEEIEVRVKGDSLQVTASAEDQAAVAQFVRLLQARGAPLQDRPGERVDSDSRDRADFDSRPEKSDRQKSGGAQRPKSTFDEGPDLQ